MNDENDDTVAKLIRMAGRRPSMNPDRIQRVREAVHGEWQRDVQQRKRARWSVAALVLAATLAGVLLFVRTPEQHEIAPSERILETPAGTFASHVWNGATLRLDANTRVHVQDDKVATLERGAIYYSSDGSTGKVTIRTPFGDVHDVGTQFEVRLEDLAVRVRVREGLVELRGTTASAGTELTATTKGIASRQIPVSGEAWAWVERSAPPFSLEGRTLGSVIDRIAREKGLTARWNGVNRDVRLHGGVPLSLDEALETATAAAGVTWRIENGELVVSP